MTSEALPLFNGEGLHLLLVEDDLSTRTTLERMLQRRNFVVASASTVLAARLIFPTMPFRLLLSDIGLPDGNGYQLMREFKARDPLVGIALTGFRRPQDVAEAHASGFSIHLGKPVSMQTLDAALANAMQVLHSKSEE